jgi:surface protein
MSVIIQGKTSVKNLKIGPRKTFISTWNVSISDWQPLTVFLPFIETGFYDGVIYWGDGTTSISSYANRSHTYAAEGEYTIIIKGDFTWGNFIYDYPIGNYQLSSITKFGGLKLDNNGYNFYACFNLDLTNVSDILDLKGITNMTNMFNAYSKATINNIELWDTSSVTDMSSMFENATLFNQDIGNWDVVHVTTMAGMFASAAVFNQDISGWNVSSVLNMYDMFLYATEFNQPIGSWDVSNCQNMGLMFYGATAFNQPLGNWDIGNVTYMNGFMGQKTSITFSASNLDSIYSGWTSNGKTVQPNITITFDFAKYTCDSYIQRNILTDTYNWTIIDGGAVDACGTFTTVWTTTAGNQQVFLPYFTDGTYTGYINWGDGTVQKNRLQNSGHTYTSAGTYTVTVSGSIKNFSYAYYDGGVYYTYKQRLKEIKDWGTLNFGTKVYPFYRCAALVLTGVTGVPNLTDGPILTTNNKLVLTQFFYGCSSLTTINNINSWDTSKATNMQSMFDRCGNFNDNIGNWNTSKVTNMISMFYQAISFNNGNPYTTIGNSMSNWITSGVTSMATMFYNAYSFNCDIGGWDVHNVQDMSSMFNMSQGSSQFNNGGSPSISGWNVSNVTTMVGMFSNSQLGGFFNQPIGSWNVSNVTNMNSMLQYQTAFTQNIGSWNVRKVTSFTDFLKGKTPSTFPAQMLTNIYTGWTSGAGIQYSYLLLDIGTAKYTADGQAGKQILTGSPYFWTVVDGGQV